MSKGPLFVGALLGCWLPSAAVYACGCFAQPNPVQRTVQAGERIVFAQRGEQMEMHVQVNYEGDAERFGWLLPVPAVPELAPGTDRLFSVLDGSTAPRFSLRTEWDASCAGYLAKQASRDSAGGTRGGSGSFSGRASSTSGGFGGPPPPPPPDPLVIRENVGAFDAAVLRADDAQAMFDWLREESFLVPVEPDSPALAPYLGPGRFFVALKLRSDREVGDLQPLVLRFDAPGAMVPITLTQVGATDDMPVVVWVLGQSRGIPRNYRHTTLNLEHIDWYANGDNYVDVVTRAVDEAEGAHSFVTEYAQPMGALGDVLTVPELDARELKAVSNLDQLVDVLQDAGVVLDAKLVGFLRNHVPFPANQAEARGMDEDTFYGLLFFVVRRGQIDGSVVPVDGEAIAAEIYDEIIEPLEDATRLFRDFGYVTRLFTTLSPREMTLDPAFAFSSALPAVGRDHTAVVTRYCDGADQLLGDGWIELPDGRRFWTSAEDWLAEREAAGAPYSARIEALRMDRPPDTLIDNAPMMSPSTPSAQAPVPAPGAPSLGESLAADPGGCRTPTATVGLALLAGIGLSLSLRRRRRV
jgi:hypothetical protein